MSAKPIALIPAAGQGTRLKPHTHMLPKVLLQVAGKPILGHILDDLPGLGIDEVILIVGYHGERVVRYVKEHHPRLKAHFVEQPERLGLGHAVSLGASIVGGRPLLVILGDTIFEADLAAVLKGGVSSIGVKEVEDPRRFGIVETDARGRVTRMVEKPEHPTSKLAITGVYYFTSGAPLFAALEDLRRRDIRTRGEFQLTDGMQRMVEQGEELTTFPILGWYDCGKTETLLETNRVLLEKRASSPAPPGTIVIPPVVIAENAVVENSIVGPHVSIGAGARLKNTAVRNTIVYENATLEDILLEDSVVGEHAVVRGRFDRVNVGDSSEVS
jgi:glucose-1-phosphate thymidylyltransferase